MPKSALGVRLRDKTLRTIGASAVILGLVVAGFTQLNLGRETPVEINPVATPSTSADVSVRGARATGPSSTEAIVEPFVYRLGVLSGVTTDNFWAFYGSQPSVWNSYILGPTKPALFSLDASTGSLDPELASGEASPRWNGNGWWVVVPLNERYHWSDGEPITARDYVFTFDTVRDLDLGGTWAEAFPSTIDSVHADSPYELRIEFSERPNLATWPNGAGLAPVMPSHIWADQTDVADAGALYGLSGGTDVSGGPLELATYTDTLLVSVANPGYPALETPDTVEYHVYATEDDLVAAVLSGEIDSALTPKGLTQEQIAVVDQHPEVEILANPANGIRYLGFNMTRDPMSDLEFRTAVALLLDRDSLAETTPLSSGAAQSIVPRANTQWFDDEAAQKNAERYAGSLSDRLGRAVEGLKAVGYAWATEPTVGDENEVVAGTGLTIGGRGPQPLTILTPGDAYDPGRPVYVQQIADTLALLGFDARPVETDFDTVVDLAFTPGEDGELHYDMYMLGWTLGNTALPDYYRPLFSSDGVMNNTGYSSKAFNSALAEYENAHSVEVAREALWRMETSLFSDLPYLPLYAPQITEIYRSDRVAFSFDPGLGGLQARLGGIGDVQPAP